jgi:hypothetical protein
VADVKERIWPLWENRHTVVTVFVSGVAPCAGQTRAVALGRGSDSVEGRTPMRAPPDAWDPGRTET